MYRASHQDSDNNSMHGDDTACGIHFYHRTAPDDGSLSGYFTNVLKIIYFNSPRIHPFMPECAINFSLFFLIRNSHLKILLGLCGPLEGFPWGQGPL